MVIGRDKPQPEKVDQNQVSNADFEFVTLNDQATERSKRRDILTGAPLRKSFLPIN
ncbi:hypothetical protein S101258_02836 [Lactiplantibacillus plantarum subsp. plantarum]|uniref:Uncharacterized protein n=1 Tax=Lactiplantibacillus plantarum subsp. plantarum TaxID=337330 RepID=A0A2S3U259_LACPN|nr:hypothetical protein S101258_02836 [Lactiplantibacillus plantarum subsp. plantarum]